ncbi:peroxisomal membrane protein 11B-like [Liolophura sinensis]|uniref:peroxisomal membrane protein 11B-like n=1 Tax=Liolophura sinensis TaxID=3198878 RepID=UPI0031598F21
MSGDFVVDVIKFNAQTAGRDKVCRLIQYGSKFLWYRLQQSHTHEELLQKLKSLESAVSNTRKLLRFGKSFDFFHGALKTLHLSDVVLRLTLTLSKINQACYLLIDHLVWMGRVGLVHIDMKKWLDVSARFWLVSIMLNLVRDVYDIIKVLTEAIQSRKAMLRRSQYNNGDTQYKDKEKKVLTNIDLVVRCVSENKPLMLDFLKNGADFFLPMSSLGHIQTSAGTQGILGVVSSVIGVLTVWNPLLRLVPS